MLEMKTAQVKEPELVFVLKAERLNEFEKASSRKGTDIMVSDLFFNTPARLKYMKTIHTELGNITDVVNRLALSHPEVSIRLIHNEESFCIRMVTGMSGKCLQLSME